MKSRRFTLIEVIVALAVLGLGITGMLELVMNSQLRLARSAEKWRHTHMLIQAAEYLLLQPDSTDLQLPDEFFPYPGYTVYHSFEDASGLPDEFTSATDALPFKCLVIELVRQSDREKVDSLHIDQLLLDQIEGTDSNESR